MAPYYEKTVGLAAGQNEFNVLTDVQIPLPNSTNPGKVGLSSLLYPASCKSLC